MNNLKGFGWLIYMIILTFLAGYYLEQNLLISGLMVVMVVPPMYRLLISHPEIWG